MSLAADNKRIAKNTIFLYIRMIVSIVINLYTVRLLWNILGIENYGIYNVVGGIVLMFAFLNNAMIASSQRFISFELGKGNPDRLQQTFSASLVVHFILAGIIFILGETIGLWFLNYRLNIPEIRLVAANWVYQCSIASFLISIISVPYNACIVAHEHMKIYGYLGILDVILRLIVVFIIAILPFDPLITYSILILIVSGIMRLIYSLYCKRHFAECKFVRGSDHDLMKDLFSFAGWSFLGNMGFSIRDQGLNILINMFFNVSINAAKGIANQVGNVINGFASNFTMAVNPQITKLYAKGEIESMIGLMISGCRYALILMSIVVIPLIISSENVLSLWLTDVAPYTVGFLQLTLIISLIDCAVSPITTSIQATGKIKNFQIIISIIMLLNIPFSWIWLKWGGSPYSVMIVCVCTSILALITRLKILHGIIPFSYKNFFMKVYSRFIPLIILSYAISWTLYRFFNQGFCDLLIFVTLTEICMAYLIYTFLLTKQEKYRIVSKLKGIITKL